jgi:hypothetical protein
MQRPVLKPIKVVLIVASVLLARSILTIFGDLVSGWWIQCIDVRLNAISYLLGLLAPFAISFIIFVSYAVKKKLGHGNAATAFNLVFCQCT